MFEYIHGVLHPLAYCVTHAQSLNFTSPHALPSLIRNLRHLSVEMRRHHRSHPVQLEDFIATPFL